MQWFDGNAEQAFAAAKQQDKPLFLYWGAEWCPPCHELKATVFSEPSFVRTSRQFIALYLDGDSPGAQKQAERFKVMGYPTLVVFNAQGVELTRIPNGLDLAAYATVLDATLEDLQPVNDLLAKGTEGQTLSASECQAIAQHSWSQDPGERPITELVTGLQLAQQQCPGTSEADRAALLLRRLILSHGLMSEGKLELRAEQLAADRQEVMKLLNQEHLLTANFYLFLDAGEPLAALFAQSTTEADKEILTSFTQHYTRLANDTDQTLFNRIQVSRVLYALLAEYGSAESLHAANKDLAAQAQSMDRKDPKFHATINAAGNLLRESGELQAAKELLLAESKKSKYGYYFMSELAHIEDLLGNEDEALRWLQTAYQQSRGPSTRFQWGVNYLRGLLEMDADNLALIEQQFTAVFDELPSESVMYQRSRVRLVALQDDLKQWSEQDSERTELYKKLNALGRHFQAAARDD